MKDNTNLELELKYQLNPEVIKAMNFNLDDEIKNNKNVDLNSDHEDDVKLKSNSLLNFKIFTSHYGISQLKENIFSLILWLVIFLIISALFIQTTSHFFNFSFSWAFNLSKHLSPLFLFTAFVGLWVYGLFVVKVNKFYNFINQVKKIIIFNLEKQDEIVRDENGKIVDKSQNQQFKNLILNEKTNTNLKDFLNEMLAFFKYLKNTKFDSTYPQFFVSFPVIVVVFLVSVLNYNFVYLKTLLDIHFVMNGKDFDFGSALFETLGLTFLGFNLFVYFILANFISVLIKQIGKINNPYKLHISYSKLNDRIVKRFKQDHNIATNSSPEGEIKIKTLKALEVKEFFKQFSEKL